MPIIGSSGAPLRTNPPPMEYQTCSSTKLAAERLESHAIGVRGHALPLFEHHVTVVVEMDAFEAGEVQSIIQRADLADVHHVVGIHGGRQIAFEPSHRSTIGAVAETGQRQRTIKRDFDTCGAIDQMVGLQRGGESMCRDHRAYGVRG